MSLDWGEQKTKEKVVLRGGSRYILGMVIKIATARIRAWVLRATI